MPSVITETVLADTYSEIDFDFDKFHELIINADVPEPAYRGLSVHMRSSPPRRYSKMLWSRNTLGLYIHSPTEPEIHLNLPLLSQVESLTGMDYNPHTKTLLHEVGHLQDIQHNGRSTPSVSDFALVGGWITGAIAPPVHHYMESGNILSSIGIGAISFVSSTVALGAVARSLEKRGRTTTGKGEKVARNFADEHLANYPNIISVTEKSHVNINYFSGMIRNLITMQELTSPNSSPNT